MEIKLENSRPVNDFFKIRYRLHFWHGPFSCGGKNAIAIRWANLGNVGLKNQNCSTDLPITKICTRHQTAGHSVRMIVPPKLLDALSSLLKPFPGKLKHL